MIAYFSGTGNSKYVAQRIAEKTGDERINLNEKIKKNDTSKIEGDGRFILVMPTYAWKIPRIVRDWVLQSEFKGVDKAWYVMTCGDSIGNADGYNKKISAEKGFKHMGTAKIIMPENYIAMFKTPTKEEAKKIIADADRSIEKAIEDIRTGNSFSGSSNLGGKILSSLINGCFYTFVVKSKAFYAKENCIGCGQCEKWCPLNNITMENKKPAWGTECTHCMACISYCPVNAIEYGKKSEGKYRYTLEDCLSENK